MPYESALYLVANLILFALLLLYWANLFRPKWVPKGMLLGTLVLFVSWQGIALVWSALRLGPWTLAHLYLSTMFLTEASLLVYLFLESLSKQRRMGAFVLTLSFVIHTYAILVIPPPFQRSLEISPFTRSPWHLLHLFTALIAYGAYTCAAGGSIGYFVVGHLSRSRLATQLPSRQDCQTLIRRALVIGFPWLSGSLVAGAVWAQLAWSSYWSWRPVEVWLLILWLILTITLHARTMPGWRGRPLALLSLLGFALALLGVRLLGQGVLVAW